MIVEPYLFFEGRCDEALEFYRNAIGAEVTALMRYNECPDPEGVPPGAGDKVMHASFRVGETTIMASDGNCDGSQSPTFAGFSLTISVNDEAHATRLFNALADGGEIRMPLGKTFFAPLFGMVADRFGVGWFVIVTP